MTGIGTFFVISFLQEKSREENHKMNKISRKEKVSYGMGDLACNTIFTVVSSYLMFFYTDIAGIGLGAIGIIMSVSRIVDAVTDPMMGVIVDKTKTKYGKARPYILWMAIPFAIISVLMFRSPDIGENGKFVYALITYILFCCIYTALNIPYTALLSNLTDDVGERLSFNMFKTLGSQIGGFIATGVTLSLAAVLGDGNQERGFSLSIALYGVFAVILLFTCFKNTKERIAAVEDQTSFKDSLKAGIKNKPWIVTCVLCFLAFTGIIMKGSSAMYYAKYYLEQEGIASVLLSISSLVAIPLALVTPAIAKKIGKRNCVLWGNVLLALGTVCTGFAEKNIPMIILFMIIASVGSGIAVSMGFVMVADTVDYSEWMTGVRAQGFFSAAAGFMVKLGMAVAGVVSTAVMAGGGYVENAVQTASSISAIRANYIWIPAVIAVFAAILSLFYDLDKKYGKVVAELHERRKKKEV